MQSPFHSDFFKRELLISKFEFCLLFDIPCSSDQPNGEKQQILLGLGTLSGPGLGYWKWTVSPHVLNSFTDHQDPKWPWFNPGRAEQGSSASFVHLTLVGRWSCLCPF